MRKIVVYSLAMFCLGICASCDEGNIPETKAAYIGGHPVKLTGHLTGLRDWGEGYSVVLATFNDNQYDDYDIGQRRILADWNNRDISIVWEASSDATSLELCLVSPLRERILTFKKVDITADPDTIRLDVGTLDVGLYSSILGLFEKNSCTRCHGEGDAAQLWLDHERAYASLVNQPAFRTEFDGLLRVAPGDASNSALHLMLSQDYTHTQPIGVNHKAIFKNNYPLSLIDAWINNGAKR